MGIEIVEHLVIADGAIVVNGVGTEFARDVGAIITLRNEKGLGIGCHDQAVRARRVERDADDVVGSITFRVQSENRFVIEFHIRPVTETWIGEPDTSLGVDDDVVGTLERRAIHDIDSAADSVIRGQIDAEDRNQFLGFPDVDDAPVQHRGHDRDARNFS